MGGTSLGRDAVHARRERRIGAIGMIVAVGLPAILWHGVIAREGERFSFSFRYLSGWAPWLLMAVGIAFFVPVAVSAGLDPESRFYPRGRNAYLGWGITLYLLGFALATQVASMMFGPAHP
jgi:hypothetical protein